jgi:hypothetical protein
MKLVRSSVLIALIAAASLSSGCGDDKKPPAPGGSPPPVSSGQHSGKLIELGAAKAGPFAIRASREEAPVKAGGDAPIDVWVDSGPKVSAVRFWVGLEDAKGSIKERAAIEDPAKPNQWHTHAPIPDPMPAGSRLWVEIEGEGGTKGTASFDLKM